MYCCSCLLATFIFSNSLFYSYFQDTILCIIYLLPIVLKWLSFMQYLIAICHTVNHYFLSEGFCSDLKQSFFGIKFIFVIFISFGINTLFVTWFLIKQGSGAWSIFQITSAQIALARLLCCTQIPFAISAYFVLLVLDRCLWNRSFGVDNA